jgi:cysteine desulfurase/selenocysteine lyase
MAAPPQQPPASIAPSGSGGALPPTPVVLGAGSSPSGWDLPAGLGSPSGIAAPTNGASSTWSAPDPARGVPSEPTRAPFGAFELPVFGEGQPANVEAMPDAFRLPMFDDAAVDAPPYFLPGADAVSIDSATASPIEAGEPRHRDEPVIRELGGVAFDPYAVRKDFPILDERVHGNKRLVWLDNAATTQKPRAVIDRLTHFYEHENSNVHRAAHTLAARATDAFESARETTRKFLGASSASEIIFVRGATEGINLIAQSWGRRNVEAGDEIVLTHLEHHANIVPWQMLCAQTGARLRIAPVDDRGDVILEEYEKLLNGRTKLVSFTQVSNALGTITPAREMIEIAHRYGAHVVLDGAQAVSHMAVDVQQLDCDFYVFSGHKVFAPTGIGAVFGKRDVLAAMPPWQGGGNMIQDVTFERTTYNPPPGRFEAGTGNIADAAGLGAALDYVMRLGMDRIDRYEHELLVYATERLAQVPGLRMIGTSPHKAGVLSFVLDGQRTEDVGAALDKEGIAVRSGHHCAQPILRRFGLESTVRASLAFYNVCEDIDALVDAVTRLQSHRRTV